MQIDQAKCYRVDMGNSLEVQVLMVWQEIQNILEKLKNIEIDTRQKLQEEIKKTQEELN